MSWELVHTNTSTTPPHTPNGRSDGHAGRAVVLGRVALGLEVLVVVTPLVVVACAALHVSKHVGFRLTGECSLVPRPQRVWSHVTLLNQHSLAPPHCGDSATSHDSTTPGAKVNEMEGEDRVDE